MKSPILHAALLSAALSAGGSLAQDISSESSPKHHGHFEKSVAHLPKHHGHFESHKNKETLPAFRKDIHILLYDQDSTTLESDPTLSIRFFKDRSKLSGIRTTVYGGRLKHMSSADKLRQLKPLLEVANPNEVVVVANARDVVLNVPQDGAAASKAVDAFLKQLERIRRQHPHAVVFSTQEICKCPSMSYSLPGDYFDAVTQQRTQRACSSSQDDCNYQINENSIAWREALLDRAYYETESTGRTEYHNVFLNSGILAGYPKDLLKILNLSDMDSTEDDEAVLTDLMLKHPDMIQLDYHQELFGVNQVDKGLENGCMYKRDSKDEPLFHSESTNQPLFLHTPQNFYDCLDSLIEILGGTSEQRFLKNYGAGEEGIQRRKAAFTESTAERRLDEMDDKMMWVYGLYGNYGGTPVYKGLGLWNAYDFFNKLFGNGNYGPPGNYGTQGVVAGMVDGLFGAMTNPTGRSEGSGNAYAFDFRDFFFGNGNYGNYGNYGESYGSFENYESEKTSMPTSSSTFSSSWTSTSTSTSTSTLTTSVSDESERELSVKITDTNDNEEASDKHGIVSWLWPRWH